MLFPHRSTACADSPTYRGLRNSGGFQKLNTEQNTVLDNYYRDFIRNGAELDGDNKKRFAEIKSTLSKLTLQFGDNVLSETNAFVLHITDASDLDGLPDFQRDPAAT